MDAFIPIVFPSGFKVTSFTTQCGKCGRSMKMMEMKARVDFPLDSVANITVVSMCPACDVATVTKRRVKSDGGATMAQYFDERGDWVSVKIGEKGILPCLKRLIWK